jgi:DNA-binding SARP family transcriptional activator
MGRVPDALARPPAVDHLPARSRVTAALLEPPVPAVLLVAPAGTGKTVAALHAGAAHAGRVGWFRLAPGYGRAADLVAVAHVALGVPAPSQLDRAPAIDHLNALVELLEREATVLVVDDYHHAAGDECDPLLAEVVALLSPTSRLVVCSRERPSGLIGRAALHGHAALPVVDAPALAFTVDEIATRIDPDRAVSVHARTAGWAAAVGVEVGAGPNGVEQGFDELVRALVVDLPADERAAAEALVVLPHLTPTTASALGLDAAVLGRLADHLALVSVEGSSRRLTDAARDALAPLVAPVRADRIVVEASPALARDEPAAAIDLLLDHGHADLAADLIAAHLSELGVDRSVRWLYRLPAPLRHRFPPLVAAGQATVDLDEARAEAQRRVDEASDDGARREALLALGSADAHGGALAAAAQSFEAASRPGAAATVTRQARTWLGIVRWWAGDLAGAGAVTAELLRDRPPGADGGVDGTAGTDGTDGWVRWASAEVALAQGDLERAAALTSRPGDTGVDATPSAAEQPMLDGVAARVAWDAGDGPRAAELAHLAYTGAMTTGGFVLAAAAPAYVWQLIVAGRHDEARSIVEYLDRHVGRHDAFTRVHATLAMLAMARAEDDGAEADRLERRLATYRALGFAPVEDEARRRLPVLQDQAGGAALRIEVLGPTRVVVDGTDRSAPWKSRKALEVLTFLALAPARGATREEVIEAVWPERDPAKGRTLLRTALSEIRRTLEPGRPTGEPSRFVESAGDRVLLLDASTDYDEARAASSRGAWAEAFGCFRGELLGDEPYLEWAFDGRRAADSFRSEMADRVAAEASAPLAERVAALEHLLAAEPSDDDRWEQLEEAHRQAGDTAAAREVRRRREGSRA